MGCHRDHGYIYICTVKHVYKYIYIFEVVYHHYIPIYIYMVGGFNPTEKYESQWEGLSQIWNGK